MTSTVVIKMYIHLYSPKRQQQQIKSKNKRNADDRRTASLL